MSYMVFKIFLKKVKLDTCHNLSGLECEYDDLVEGYLISHFENNNFSIIIHILYG